jgi:hypothetical protein
MARHRFDALGDTSRPHWLTLADMHRNMVACEALPAGADLREALRAALAQCVAEGWQAEGDGAYGFVFIARGAERRLLNLTAADPAEGVGAGHAFLAGRGVVNSPVA